jgi:hypothetical protein
MPAVLAELSYRSCAQALVQQESSLNELRSRTGTLLAANAVTASFLGAVALKDGRLATAAGLAVICFVLSLAAALYILLPRTVAAIALAVELVLWAVDLAGVL